MTDTMPHTSARPSSQSVHSVAYRQPLDIVKSLILKSSSAPPVFPKQKQQRHKLMTSRKHPLRLGKPMLLGRVLKRLFKRSIYLKPWLAVILFTVLLFTSTVLHPVLRSWQTGLEQWLNSRTSHPTGASSQETPQSGNTTEPFSSPEKDPWLVSPPPPSSEKNTHKRHKSVQGNHFGQRLQVSLQRCYDGDTCQFVPQGETTPMKVRVAQVDAPELAQAYGKEARNYLVSLLQNAKTLELSCNGGKTYDREACVVLADGVAVQSKLVAAGYAWDYPIYSKGKYASLQATAQAKHLGVWQSKAPVSPFCWRKLYKKKQAHATCQHNPSFMP
jgi:micrococcal nuclease